MAIRHDTAKTERRYLRDMIDMVGKRILEIGCGNGRLTWQYAGDADYVAGIDVTLDGLQEGLSSRPKHLNNKVDLLAGSAIVPPFANDSFHHVILAWSL